MKGGQKIIQQLGRKAVDSGCCHSSAAGGKGATEGVGMLPPIEWGPDADPQGLIRIGSEQGMSQIFFFPGLEV